jgi:HEAT repeat protein
MGVRVLLVAMIPTLLLAGCAGTRPVRFVERAHGLESDNPDVRRESANVLRDVPVDDPEHRRALVQRLAVMAQSDPEPLVRSAALSALTVQDPERALDVATRIRTDTDDMVRWDAVKVIGRLGDTNSVGVLIGVLRNDASRDARREAARALARFEEPRVVDALIDALEDEDLSVAHAARISLTRLNLGVDLGMKPGPWRRWWHPETTPGPAAPADADDSARVAPVQ